MTVPVLQEELLLVTYRRIRCAKKEDRSPADLDSQPFVLFETGSITRRLVDEFFMREGIEPQIVMETENVEIIKAMVRNGLGISIIPWQAAAATSRAGSCSAAGSRAHRWCGRPAGSIRR